MAHPNTPTKPARASRRAADAAAVGNFLSSLDGLSATEAFANLRQDARSYGWNAATVDAIARGISRRFCGRSA